MEAIVAITGASGVAYGIRLVRELLGRGDDIYLIISPSGLMVLKEEMGLDLSGGCHMIRDYLKNYFGDARGGLKYLPSDDLMSPLSSGSSLRRLMIICPSSMGTLARIAHGISGNLIERAADCILKEGGRLILVPRETPLNAIHLENMLKLARMGALIAPAMPAFYARPERIGDLIDFVVGKVLDLAGIKNELYKRWD